VTLVAPDAGGALGLLAEEGLLPVEGSALLDLQLRPYEAGEVAAFRLAVAATGRAAVDRQVFEDAERAGVWVNCADDIGLSSFVLPAVHRDGPVTVAVSTSGSSPALARWLRDELARVAGSGIGTMARLVDEARRSAQRQGVDTTSIPWRSLSGGPLPGLVRAGRVEEARSLLARTISRSGSAGREVRPQ
jgi:siroheme synthase-like protein